MTPADIDTVAALLPPSIVANGSDQDALEYIVLLICPGYGFRPADAERSLSEIIKRARALRQARAA
jgi:hypothetical protein